MLIITILHVHLHLGTPEEKARTFDDNMSYTGTYSFDGEKVVHHVTASSYPNFSGSNLMRYVKFNGVKYVKITI